jgi:hypothetical protein
MGMNPRLLRPTASGFDPRRISGLAAWWDSTDNSKITTSTGVSAWVDKSANAYTVSQGTGANQPSISSINGRQAFGYNGSSQFLNSASSGLAAIGTTSTNAAPTYTAFYVASFSGLQLTIPCGWGNSTSAVPFHAAIHPTNSGNVFFWRGSYRTDANSSQFDSGTGSLTSATPYVVSSRLSSAGIVGRANGTQVVSLAVPSGNLAVTVDRFAVGALLRDTALLFVNGQIGDVLIYNRVLSAAEITAVERWLGGKFGITVT